MTTITGLWCILKGSEDKVSFCFEGFRSLGVCVCVCLKNWHEKLFAMLIYFFFSLVYSYYSVLIYHESTKSIKHQAVDGVGQVKFWELQFSPCKFLSPYLSSTLS